MPATMNSLGARRAGPAAVLAIGLVLLAGCGGSRPPAGDGGSGGTGSTGGAQSGQVVISGAINKTYVPEEVAAVKIGEWVGINVVESLPCGVTIQIPLDTPPGTYTLEDHLHSPVVERFGEYDAQNCDDSPEELSHAFLSTTGTLTLTAAGERYSGTFAFTAGSVADESDTIEVTGSFSDVPAP